MSRINAKIKQDQQSAAGNPGSFADLTTQLAADVSGYMKSTTGTGTISVQPTPIPVADGGTGQANEQNAINALSQVSGATNEHVLTKDTLSGNAMYKAVAFDIVNDVTPQLGAGLDNNGFGITDGTLNILTFGETASAVNNVKISNAATGNAPNIEAIGSDTNISIVITPKGTGTFQVAGSTGTLTPLTTNAHLNLSGNGTGAVRTSNALQEKRVTLTDGPTPALDASLGNVFYLDAADNRTIAVPTNAPASGYTQKITIVHFANGGARTLSLNTGAGGFRFGTDITALTATSSGLMDYIGCIWNETDSFWDVVAYSKGY